MAFPDLRKIRRTLSRARGKLADVRERQATSTLSARLLQAPRLRTIEAIQQQELMKLPSGEGAALRRKGFSPRPIRGRDFEAIKFKGTKVPVTATGVNTSRFQLGSRTLRQTLVHEIGHQQLFLRKVPVERHHDTLK